MMGRALTRSLGLPDSQAVNTGIPDGATVAAVGAGGSMATMSAVATKTGDTAVDIVGGFAAVDITLAELSVAPLVATTDEERAARQAHVQQAEADFDPLPFDAAAARAFGRVAASLRRAGRKPSARAYDAMIAAVCVANELPIHTCNPDEFSGIDGLNVVDVPKPIDLRMLRMSLEAMNGVVTDLPQADVA